MYNVYFKFKHQKDECYRCIPVDDHFISVGNLKDEIFQTKYYGRGKDFDFEVFNAQSNGIVYSDEDLIPKHTSVLIRRLAGSHCKTITPRHDKPNVATSSSLRADSSIKKCPQDSDLDDFGDLYEITGQSSNLNRDAATPLDKADQNSKISASNFRQCKALDGFPPGRAFGSERMLSCSGQLRFEWKTPPHGYICYRCKVPGHFIKHCPTNGDRDYDIKVSKPPASIWKSMLIATPDGSYASSSSSGSILKPNEASFQKEVEGIQVDVLLTNKLVKDTINPNLGRTENVKSTSQLQDTVQLKLQSPTLSAASKGAQMSLSHNEKSPDIKKTANEGKAVNTPEQTSEKVSTVKVACALLAEEKFTAADSAKEKKKKEESLPVNEMQWETSQDFAAEKYMMPHGASIYNPYWNGMQPGMEGYMALYAGAMPYMSNGFGSSDVLWQGVFPHGTFGSHPVIPPQRVFSEDRECAREMSSSGDTFLVKSKSRDNCILPERSSTQELNPPPRLPKRNLLDRDRHGYESKTLSQRLEVGSPRPAKRTTSSSSHHHY